MIPIKTLIASTEDLDLLFLIIEKLEKPVKYWVSRHPKYSYDYEIVIGEHNLQILFTVYAKQENKRYS